MVETYELFVRCAGGFESELAAELKELKIDRIRPLKGGVAFFGTLEQAYRVCLWSRVASRVLLVLSRFDAHNADTLYQGVQRIDWSEHVGKDATIAVHAHGVNDGLRNTQFTAVKVKDAICDQLRDKRGVRPNVSAVRPDLAINVALRKNKATISLDISGEPLHRRGYRKDGVQSEAPLKESLAAALVLAAGWKQQAKKGSVFLDPFCGSGTLAIEAAMIASDKAPGLMRDYWGFTGWLKHDEDTWNALLDEAEDRFEKGLEDLPPLMASDHDEVCISLAKENAKRAGFAAAIEFFTCDVADIGNLSLKQGPSGLLVTNPPYGERLGTQADLSDLYDSFSKGIQSLPDAWRVAVITPDASIDGALGLIPQEKVFFYNGRIETYLRIYEIDRASQIHLEVISLEGRTSRITVLEKNSEQFAARLRKVAKERKKWAHNHGISCYRVYDADLPDYSVAIDVYEGVGKWEGQTYLHIAEYRAPKTIDDDRAARRWSDVLAIAPAVLGIDPERVHSKVRLREKGGKQYQNAGLTSTIIHSQESGYVLKLDLGAYLDTGLFLDHRITREMVGQMAKDKRFLNLFAYTGTATLHAAGAGAKMTTTVDLSQTYVNWAQRNMALNDFTGSEHQFIRADVRPWIESAVAQGVQYDCIFIDPPTFSNSKAMGKRTWSVDRDHVELLTAVAKLLSSEGKAVFSCNLRSFKPDHEALGRHGIKLADITAETIPEDFKRNPKIHHCYIMTLAD